MNNQTFVILPVLTLTEEFIVDFDQTSLSTVRKSLDGTLAVLAWCGSKPQALTDYEAIHGPCATYDHSAIVSVMQSAEWRSAREISAQPTRSALRSVLRLPWSSTTKNAKPSTATTWQRYAAYAAGAAAVTAGAWAMVHFHLVHF